MLAGKWFCYQHAPIWEKHYELVARIKAIPDRKSRGRH